MSNKTTTDVIDDLRGLSGLDYVGHTAIRAADEITHLRAELARLREVPHSFVEVIARELCRLDIMCGDAKAIEDSIIDGQWKYHKDDAELIASTIRAALAHDEAQR